MPRDITEIPALAADRWVRYGEDPNQFFDLWKPAATMRASAVMIHGGFWRSRYDLAHASHLCAALAQRGFAVASLEYRRVGNAGGGWPGTFRDIVAGIKAAIQEFGLQNRTVILGHSAGGHLGLRLATEKVGIVGTVALAPVADLRLAYDLHLSNDAVVEFLGGTPEEIPSVYDDACPSRHAPGAPCILVHGTADDVVPLQLSERYVDAVGDQSKATLIKVEGANHFDLIDPASAGWPSVLRAVDKLLE